MARKGSPVGTVVQVTTFEGQAAVDAWRRTASFRAAYMAGTTTRLLDMAGVRAGSRVLAVGVGTGGEALDAAVRVGANGHVVAVDLSAAMIAGAGQAAAESGLTNLQFKVMDAQRLDFRPASFDAVISRNVLMFVPDLQRALEGMRRVLRPSCRLGLTVWSTPARNPRISGPLAATRTLGVEPPESATYRIALRLGRPSILRAALRSAGFKNVRVERVFLVADYASLDEAVAGSMETAATKELVGLLGVNGEVRMRRSLERRWARYADSAGAHLPGEQLVAAGEA